jgi:hypothetical protein
VVLQLAAMYVPGLRTLLRSAPLGLGDLATVAVGATAPYVLNEFAKDLLPLRNPSPPRTTP